MAIRLMCSERRPQGGAEPAVDQRYELMRNWLSQVRPGVSQEVTPASGDASFRRYFRVRGADGTAVVMDAPPDQVDCRPFIVLAEAFRDLGLQTPQVLAADLEQGFLLLSDLGECQYLTVLSEASVGRLYDDALAGLARLQTGGDLATDLLPPYDAPLLRRELELFREWYLIRHLGLRLREEEHDWLDAAFAMLIASALEQPRVWTHRDYHSRNLMVTESHNPGVLDFQDAVIGPLTYDLVSLLRDCYIAWPQERVEAWALGHRERLREQGLAETGDAVTFLRWFDLMGVQRHLKAAGIFARLNIRDGKPGYLGDIPRTLNYVWAVSSRYGELAGLRRLLQERVMLW